MGKENEVGEIKLITDDVVQVLEAINGENTWNPELEYFKRAAVNKAIAAVKKEKEEKCKQAYKRTGGACMGWENCEDCIQCGKWYKNAQ